MIPDLLVFAPRSGGHHAEFVRWILQAGADRGLRLALAASPDLLESAPDLGGLATDAEPIGVAGGGGVKPTAAETLAMLANAGERMPARRTLHTYLDDALVALAHPRRPALPPRLAGLLFRAPFRAADPFAGRLRLTARRLVLGHVARGAVETVLTLDPAVVPNLRRLGADAYALPDPVDLTRAPTATPPAVRAAYGVEPGRALAILFGSLEERKGVLTLAESLRHLPTDAARRLAVVVAGRSPADVRDRVADALRRADAETDVQVIFREAFLPDADLTNLTAAADLVLAPYQEHVGSSGIVLRAAAAGVPLIAQSAAQMGREVRTHRLGQSIDPSPEALADAIVAALNGHTAFDPDAARAYAQSHSVDHFTDALFDALFSAPPCR